MSEQRLPPPPGARAVIAEADDWRAVVARPVIRSRSVRSRSIGDRRRAVAAIAGRGHEIVIIRIVALHAGNPAAHADRTLALRDAAGGVDGRGVHVAVLALIRVGSTVVL